MDLLETEKGDGNEERELGEDEDSSYTGSRKTKIKDELHEAITKMTLHNILLQPESKPLGLDNNRVSAMDSKSEDKGSSDAGKAGMANSNKGDKKGTNAKLIQKRESSEENEKSTTASVSGDAPKTAVSSGVEANTTRLKKLEGVNQRRHEDELQANGESEFSGKDPLAVFLGTSGSDDGQSSGDDIHQKATPTQTSISEMESGGHESNEESAVLQDARLQTHSNPTNSIVKGEDETGSGRVSVDPLLLFQVRKIRMNVLKAERQATKELNDVRKDFRLKMEDLEEDLKMVRKLTSNVHRKVGLTVKQALAMARQAKRNATSRLFMARRAATALNNIEKRLGVVHTHNASRILRSRIPQFPNLNDVALYKQLLTTDAILTKLDGAKMLAVSRAEKRFRNEEETGSSITKEVHSLRDELATAEKELSDETEAEMEDERVAQEKLEEAMNRNKVVAKKTAFALAAIENYLEKLQSDESKLKRLRFY